MASLRGCVSIENAYSGGGLGGGLRGASEAQGKEGESKESLVFGQPCPSQGKTRFKKASKSLFMDSRKNIEKKTFHPEIRFLDTSSPLARRLAQT